MKKSVLGFTLIEVLVSMAISGVIMLAAITLLVKTFSVEGNSVLASQQIDLVMILNGIRDKLTNVPKLYPPQNLYDPDDKKFVGITDVYDNNDLKKYCHQGHALVYTITDTTKEPAKIIRFWQEQNLETGINKTLVINFDPGTTKSNSFPVSADTDEVPRELIAIDADGKIKRSYIIKKVQYFTTPQTPDVLTQEPYSDPHVAITVQLPSTLRDSQASKPEAGVSFVSESLLYPSASYFICLKNDTMDLIEAPLYAPTKQTILIASQKTGNRISLTEFKTEFIGTREDKRIDLSDYYTNLSEAPSVTSAVKTKSAAGEYEVQVSKECMNIIRLTLVAQLKSANSNANIEKIVNMKTVFINNFMPERPAKCQNGM